MGSFLKDVWKLSRWWLSVLLFRLVEDRFYEWVNSKIDESQWFKTMMEWWGQLLDSGIGITGLIFMIGVVLSLIIAAAKLKAQKPGETISQKVNQTGDGIQAVIFGSPNATVTQTVGNSETRLTPPQCEEMAQKLRVLSEVIEELRRTGCKDAEVRNRAVNVQQDTESWLRQTIGSVSAQRFSGASPSNQISEGMAYKFAGIYQKLVGQRDYLSKESSRVCD